MGKKIKLDLEVQRCFDSVMWNKCPLLNISQCAEEGLTFDCDHPLGPGRDFYQAELDKLRFPEGCPLPDVTDEEGR